MFSPLTPAQLQRMKEHKYCSQGTSLSEPVMQVYWRWLVTKVPLWMAPNLITFVGLIVNILTTAPIVLVDYNVDGVAPRWLYFLCALGFFIYQSLDAIDGKQARRTGTNSPLGELFDHGCDSISTYLVVVSGISAIGVSASEHPYMILYFMELLMLTNLCYHWQTYVCGVLHFKLIDVTEAQLAHILLLMLTVIFGVEMWDRDSPVIGVANNLIIALIFTVFMVINLIQAFYIILTGGVGKGGTTVAGTDVLSPIFAPLVLILLAGLAAYFSPSHSLENNAMLFTAALSLPLAKPIITMVPSLECVMEE